MKKSRFFIYLLSTSLVIPTFTISTAYANDNDTESNFKKDNRFENSDKVKKETTQKENKTSKSDSNSTKESNKKAKKEVKQNKETTSNDTTSKSSAKDSQKSDNGDDLFLFNHMFNNEKSNNSSQSMAQQHLPFSQMLTSLFNTEQDDTTDEGSSVANSSNSMKSNESETSQEHASNTDKTKRDAEKNYDSDSVKTQTDDQDISESLNALDKEDSNELNQHDYSDNDTSDTEQSKNKNNNEQSTGEKTSTASSNTNQNNDKTNNNQHSKSSDSNKDNVSDSVIDSILDEYSEDAQRTHQSYKASKSKDNYASASSKENQTNQQQDQSINAQKDLTSRNLIENPQLPSQQELKHQTQPSQSFENNIKKSNTRSTELFQNIPNLSDDENNKSLNVVESKKTRQFIKSIAKDAHHIGQKEDIYASVMIAQAILESNSGKSTLAQSPNYNLFGIKGSYKGQSATFNTLEATNSNQMYSIQAAFRAYPNTKASLQDYADLMKHGIDNDSTFYQPTWKSKANNYRSATSYLSRTYATDPNYANKLNSLIKHYHLTIFDNKKMPSLKHYHQQVSEQNTSGSDFKPFVESHSSNPYPYGQCTWYVYERLKQFDLSISGDLGDAHHWNNRAEERDYDVTTTPSKHSVAVFEAGQANADDYYGHVAFVEKVNNDGSILISESNVKGLGIISYRVIDAETASQLDYIQPK